MNRRIARKALSYRERARRSRLWREGYGPETGRWEIERRADRYLCQHNSRYRRTMRVVHRAGGTSWARTHEESDVDRERLVNDWADLRRYLMKRRGHRPEAAFLDEVAEGLVVGIREVAEVQAEGEITLFAFAVNTLDYFSDRWCHHRIGRMDAIAAAIAKIDADRRST